MESLEALQDRYGLPIVFQFVVRLYGGGDVRGPLLSAIAETGAVASEMQLEEVEAPSGDLLYSLLVFTRGDEQMGRVREAVEVVEGVSIVEVIDIAMESHRGGGCEMRSRCPIESNTDLRIVYTPGVARVCKAIEANSDLAREYTAISNKVGIVTNGTAVLGLGDIGCVPGMPVMEGKSAIFWEFAGISAEPILVDTHDPETFIETVATIAPTFGAIQVEDVKAPECFQITRELDQRLSIPVMHDDQHGTATICLAGLYSALRRKGWTMGDMKVAVSGAGAAGTAINELLQAAGVGDVVLVDSVGIIHGGRPERMNPAKEKLAKESNRDNISGGLAEAMKDAHVFIGCSQPDIVSRDMVRGMADKPILFPLANPVSEISRPDAFDAGADVYADGRYMNNAIAYPGIFRGALDSGTDRITLKMMMAAADRLAEIVPEGELLPEMMDPQTHASVADAVATAAG
ncbi:MAG: NAD-dependent malic enzyme [Planctomycetes bacterium]|jgi:malate dehydrogenase (oxaloacetate-decarboxylating)|nr:NAD-dependent malic enzyme [Planctomycetota bacterium]